MFKNFTFYALLIVTVGIFACSSESEAQATPIQLVPNDSNTTDDDATGGNNIPGDSFSLATLQIETSWNTADRATVSEDATTHGPTAYYFMENQEMVLISKEPDGKRTELKETPGQERSLDVVKSLSYTATIFNIPENGVTIAQVHNRSNGVLRPLVRVYIDDDRKVKFKLTDDPDSASQYTTVNGPLYQAGEVIEVSISTSNGTASFTATTPAGTFSETFTPSNNWAPYSEGYYFKAGVYTEGNDTRAEIRFSEFDLIK